METTTMLGTEAAAAEEAKQEVEGLTQEPQAEPPGCADGHWTAPFQVPGSRSQLNGMSDTRVIGITKCRVRTSAELRHT